jgi:hypothetical protein
MSLLLHIYRLLVALAWPTLQTARQDVVAEAELIKVANASR